MDAVILAAGRGSRLAGIAAPYHKPLLVMEGEALIARAVRQAQNVAVCQRVIIVVAPENANVISQVLPLDSNIRMVVQRVANGPGAAVDAALELVHGKRVLVLMADNFSRDSDVLSVTRSAFGSHAIGIRRLPGTMVEPFTYRTDDGSWVEKERPPHLSGKYDAWVGPLMMLTGDFTSALIKTPVGHDGFEWPIGPSFNHLSMPINCVPVETVDVGTPEAVR